jgi:hypothetical protein
VSILALLGPGYPLQIAAGAAVLLFEVAWKVVWDSAVA